MTAPVPTTANRGSLVRFVRTYMASYWLWYLAGTIALVATNWISVTIPLYLAQGIDALGQPDARGVVLESALSVAALGVITIGVRTASRVLFFTPGRLVEARVKEALFSRLLAQQPAFLRQWPTGDLVSRASSDVVYVRLLAGFVVLSAVNTSTALVLAGGQMVRLSPVLATWVFVPVTVGLLATLVVVRRMHTAVMRMQTRNAELSDYVLSAYQGVAAIQGFVAEPAFNERFSRRNRALLESTLEFANLRTIIGPTLSTAAAFNVFILLYIGGPMAVRGELSVGELVAFIALAAYLTLPLRGFSFLLSLLKQAQAALERIDAVMLPEPERPDQPDAKPAPAGPPALEIRDLTFHYPDADEPALDEVSLEIHSGGTLGIFGLTGSGKTTLLRVLARLYNPPPGTVLIDGTDVRDIDLDDWRRVMAYVPQRTFLFSESLADNVLLGRDVERLEPALKQAALEPDVEALPDGVETRVGEKGVMLSGGQRQRTALARGLVRDHQLLMLDDVLSAVDHATEHELIQTLQSRASAPTTVLVSHRLTALSHADLIIVLDSGKVVDQGTHEQLSQRPGLYRDTWLAQQAQEAVAS